MWIPRSTCPLPYPPDLVPSFLSSSYTCQQLLSQGNFTPSSLIGIWSGPENCSNNWPGKMP